MRLGARLRTGAWGSPRTARRLRPPTTPATEHGEAEIRGGPGTAHRGGRRCGTAAAGALDDGRRALRPGRRAQPRDPGAARRDRPVRAAAAEADRGGAARSQWPRRLHPGRLRALEVDKRTLDAGGKPDSELLLAYPLVNAPQLFPEAGEQNTTIVTYLFIAPHGRPRRAGRHRSRLAPAPRTAPGRPRRRDRHHPAAGRAGPDRHRLPAHRGAGDSRGHRADRRHQLPLGGGTGDHTHHGTMPSDPCGRARNPW